MKTYLFTIWQIYRLLVRRYFRSRIAIFFSIIFPLIFLFVFGGLYSNNDDTSFKVAVINNSHTAYGKEFTADLDKVKPFKIQKDLTTVDAAKAKMKRSEIDSIIELPANFGATDTQGYPSGKAIVYYDQNGAQAGQAVSAILSSVQQGQNIEITHVTPPLSVESKSTASDKLSSFDYIFSGLLGFSLLGLGIFGPVNMLPAEKKSGALTRIKVTPLRPAQFIIAYMFSSLTTGVLSIGIMFLCAIQFFDFHMVGNYLTFAIFAILGGITIFGIGVGVGGWARDEKQAAPLSNIVSFPMMFLSGTFFPRFLMPEWLQHVSNYLPLTPIVDGLRLITTEGKTLLDLGPQLAIMGVWAIVVYAIAFRVFRWE